MPITARPRRPGPAPATAREGDLTATRDLIFAAAAAAFARDGFDGAGVDRIAARAGVNKAMLYYHFGSKRALYPEVAARHVPRRRRPRRAPLPMVPARADEKLDAWIGTIIEQAAARPWFPPIMLRELASGAPRLDPETLRA